MSLSAYFTIIFANLLGALSPGPDIILVTRMATKSRRHAVVAALGIQVGVIMWCTLTVLGATALLTALPWTLKFVQVIGGAWLLRMGWKMVRGGLHAPPASLEEAEALLGRLRTSFLMGLSTNLSNPKIVLFLAALIAPLLPVHPSLWTALALVLGLSLSSLALFIVLSFVISTPAVRRRMLAAGPWIDVAAGTFFLVAGAALIFSGLEGLRDAF